METESETKEIELERVVRVLQDEDCRKILEELTTDQLTAKKIARRSDIPLSTVYRKLDLLTDTKILEETLQIERKRCFSSEYRLTTETVTISMDFQEELVVHVSTSV